MIQAAQFRVLGERNPRLEHRHGNRWVRMDRTIPMLSDRQPKAYRSTWICRGCGECLLHEWRASWRRTWESARSRSRTCPAVATRAAHSRSLKLPMLA